MLLLLLFLVINITTSLAQPQGYSDFKLESRHGLWYKEGENKPFTGLLRLKNPFGNGLGTETKYHKGEPVWEKTYRYNHGKLQLQQHTRAWAKDQKGRKYQCDYISYNSEGGIQTTIKYNGREGIHTSYYKDGKISYKIELLEGIQHGKYIYYRENGKKQSESMWENGKKVHSYEWKYYDNDSILDETYTKGSRQIPGSNGWYRSYYADGSINHTSQWDYENGSSHRTYSSEGILISEGICPGNPNFNGIVKTYNPDTGKIYEEYIRKEGKEIIRKKYYNNGNIMTDYKDGSEKRYYPNGGLMTEITYEDEYDNYIADEKTYYQNGKLMSVMKSNRGEWEGPQILYHENGRMQAKMNFHKGVLTDKIIKTYHEDGRLQSHIFYADSGKVISGKVFYPDGKIFVERINAGNPGNSTVNIHIYADNYIFSEHDHQEVNATNNNTFSLLYILLQDKEESGKYNSYFDAGKPYPMEEGQSVIDCSCGPELTDSEMFEYLYTDNGFSGKLCYYQTNLSISEEYDFIKGRKQVENMETEDECELQY